LGRGLNIKFIKILHFRFLLKEFGYEEQSQIPVEDYFIWLILKIHDEDYEEKNERIQF